eukprot:173872_1
MAKVPENAGVEILTNFIDGKFVPPSNREYIDNRNPATNCVISKIPSSQKEDIDAAVASARAAFPQWSALGFEARAKWAERVADEIDRRAQDLARAESEDNGKPIGLATKLDIPRAAHNFRFFAGAVRQDSTSCHEMQDALNYTLRRPVGVAALITPWNLPLYLLTWKVAPALIMGNTIVAKPSELTPRTASMLAQILADIGLPKGVFNLVHGYGKDVGAPLVSHPDVSLVSFTGGTATGKLVAAAAAPSFKKLSLELGGKNPSIVFADCDLEATVAGVVRAAFANQGQICLSGSRLFVEKSIFDTFLEMFVTKTKLLTIGDPSTDVFSGSLISQEHRAKVESYVKLAQEEGGRILCGGTRPNLKSPFSDGAFYCPTVVTGVSYTSRVACEEIFGPVVTIHPFEDEADALKKANHVRYGLAGSIWSSNLSKAHRVAKNLESGTVWVNCWLKRDLRVPFGGVKDSGVGREGGEYSMRFFSESKNICVQY